MKNFFLIVLGVAFFLSCSSVQLIKAVKENDTEKAKTLITTDQGLINKKDNNDETPLMIAARNGNIELVKFLVEHGADVNITKGKIKKELGYGGKIYVGLTFWFPITWIVAPFIRDYYFKGDTSTALTVAAENNQLAIVRYLLAKKAMVNLPQKFNNDTVYYDEKKYKDAFTIALTTKNTELLITIFPYVSCEKGFCFYKLNYWSDETHTLLNYLLKINPHLVDQWLSQNPSLKNSMSSQTWLMDNLTDKTTALCEYILKKKYIPINKKNESGQTMLMLASRDGKFDAVKVLLNCGANIGLLDNQGWSAVFYSAYNYSASNYQDDITKYLIQKGANTQHVTLAFKHKRGQEEQQIRDKENHKTACAKMIYNHPTNSNTCSEICSTYFPNDYNCRSTCCECWNLLSRPSDGPCR